jgi:cell division protein FtsB
MGYIFYNQQIKLNELNTEIASCERKIQEQYLESEKLTSTIASMTKDEYIEEVARERLGYVMPTEIIFMDASI